jgi:hypothetical protein
LSLWILTGWIPGIFLRDLQQRKPRMPYDNGALWPSLAVPERLPFTLFLLPLLVESLDKLVILDLLFRR